MTRKEQSKVICSNLMREFDWLQSQETTLVSVVMDTIEKVAVFFKSHKVKCKVVRDNRQDYGDFIAIFSYGELTREQIVNKIKENNLLVMFFESSIREDIFRKKHEVN